MVMMAFDRSARSFDTDGRLHVVKTNISKATVNPYYGREIPDHARLGLDPDKIYHLLRHPDELAKGAETFNNIPLLNKHVPVSAADHKGEIVVGSTGTDAEFDGEYLTNSLVVWAKDSIDLIESELQKELSSAYRYEADMTAGEWGGLRFDGIMRNIVANHVALVDEGRAGPDVVVADGKPKMLKSKIALMLNGALAAAVHPKLAMDAKVDFTPALKNINAKNLAGKRKALAAALVGIASPKLAQDEGLDVEELIEVIDAVRGAAEGEGGDEIVVEGGAEEITEDSDDGENIAAVLDYLKDRLSDEDYAEASRLARGAIAEDEDDGEDDEGGEKTAMDRATVARMVADAEKRGAARAAALDVAREDVKPLVGKLIGMDSAEAVYRSALTASGYDAAALTGASVATLKAMVGREVSIKSTPRVAMDSAAKREANDSYNAMYGSK